MESRENTQAWGLPRNFRLCFSLTETRKSHIVNYIAPMLRGQLNCTVFGARPGAESTDWGD